MSGARGEGAPEASGPAPTAWRGSGSLRLRLLAAAAAWILVALLLAGWGLGLLFRQHVEAELAERARAQIDALVAGLAVAPDGSVTLEREPAEPLFRQPASGLYWRIDRLDPGATDTELMRSRSLWDHPLHLVRDRRSGGGIERSEARGPREQPLVVWSRQVQLEGVPGALRIAVAADVTRQQQMSRSFMRTLSGGLVLLAAVLMAAAVLQVRLGLGPLARLRSALQALRAGRSARIDGRFPAEVQPLVDELNGLLAENAAIVEQARTRTGNLAHALKTPLAVIGNAAGVLPPPARALIGEQAERMRVQLEHHLARSRAAALARSRGPGTPVAAPLADLRRTIERLYAGRGLAITLEVEPEAQFRGDPAELQEMVGNLLDNAAKWAAGRIDIRAQRSGAHLVIGVADDGPGIAPEHRAVVVERGRRLDERAPGDGLGLSIVDDLARAHGGRLELDVAPRGGLLARLTLPAAQG